MSRLALKTFVAQQLTNVDVPVPIAAFLEMPKSTTVGANVVVIVKDPKVVKSRLTLGRPAASKQADHEVQLDIYWVAQDDQGGGIRFDVLLEKIDNLFEQTVTLPQILTDPETGEISNLIYLAERITTDVLEPQLVTDDEGHSIENQVLFAAVKLLTALEIYVG